MIRLQESRPSGSSIYVNGTRNGIPFRGHLHHTGNNISKTPRAPRVLFILPPFNDPVIPSLAKRATDKTGKRRKCLILYSNFNNLHYIWPLKECMYVMDVMCNNEPNAPFRETDYSGVHVAFSKRENGTWIEN